jgi:hypothetical protein
MNAATAEQLSTFDDVMASDLSPQFRVKVSDIDPSNIQNPRINLQGIEELAKGMKFSGAPYDDIIVQAHDNVISGYKWRMRSGHRTVAAARLNKWEELNAKEFKGSQLDGKILALVEQDNRLPLRSYEKAAYFLVLKKEGEFTNKQLIDELASRGYKSGASTIANQVHWIETFPPQITTAWRDGHAAATDLCLGWLVGVKPLTRQLDAWKRIVAGEKWQDVKDSIAATNPKPQKPRATKERPTFKGAALMEAYRVADVALPAKFREFVRSFLMFNAGVSNEIRFGGDVLAKRQNGNMVTVERNSWKAPELKAAVSDDQKKQKERDAAFRKSDPFGFAKRPGPFSLAKGPGSDNQKKAIHDLHAKPMSAAAQKTIDRMKARSDNQKKKATAKKPAAKKGKK